VELANAVDFSLVAGVWSADYPQAMRVARSIRAGTVLGLEQLPLSR
jgi:acyl-CoA reductase-like NAD-dependent aldehyde dehydrogenase